jgi:helix-hairpin-helix protein
MNLTHSARRHDQPLRLGAHHGYRFDGDQVFINADLNVPPYFSGGAWSLELWACDEPYSAGPLAGVKVSEVDLRVPTPIAQHTHHVETCAPARVPPHGLDRTMVLALVERGPEGQRTVQDFSNYGQRQSFLAPHLEGAVGYAVSGQSVQLEVEGIVNSRALGNLSGTLALELWAFASAHAASLGEGKRLAAAELPRVAGQHRLAATRVSAPFSEPLPGRWQLALRLCEWTEELGYVTRDERVFALPYEQGEPSVEPTVVAPVAAPLRLVTPAATVEAEPVEDRAEAVAAAAEPLVEALPAAAEPLVEASPAPSVPASRAVSIQTASVEELAKVKGLNLKVAKEIVKARPFSSLSDLVKVRGIGEKTLQRLKPLLKL